MRVCPEPCTCRGGALGWVQYLNGTATDFFGLYFIYAGLPLVFLSVVGLLTAHTGPEPFDPWG